MGHDGPEGTRQNHQVARHAVPPHVVEVVAGLDRHDVLHVGALHIHRLGRRLTVINPKDYTMSDAVAFMTGAKVPTEAIAA